MSKRKQRPMDTVMERGEAIGTEQMARDIASLYAENQSLRADLTHLREQLEKVRHEMVVEREIYFLKLAELEATVTALRETLETYGAHRMTCTTNQPRRWRRNPDQSWTQIEGPEVVCNCGFAEAVLQGREQVQRREIANG